MSHGVAIVLGVCLSLVVNGNLNADLASSPFHPVPGSKEMLLKTFPKRRIDLETVAEMAEFNALVGKTHPVGWPDFESMDTIHRGKFHHGKLRRGAKKHQKRTSRRKHAREHSASGRTDPLHMLHKRDVEEEEAGDVVLVAEHDKPRNRELSDAFEDKLVSDVVNNALAEKGHRPSRLEEETTADTKPGQPVHRLRRLKQQHSSKTSGTEDKHKRKQKHKDVAEIIESLRKEREAEDVAGIVESLREERKEKSGVVQKSKSSLHEVHDRNVEVTDIKDKPDKDSRDGHTNVIKDQIVTESEAVMDDDGGGKRDQFLAKFAWMHIPKTGISFANTVVSWACPHLDDKATVGSAFGGREVANLTSFMEEHHQQCSKGFHFCEDHAPLASGKCNDWETHKGLFVGMFRQPEQRVMSGFNAGCREVSQMKECRLKDYADLVAGCSVRMMNGLECGSNQTVTGDMTRNAIHRLEDGFSFVGLTEEWALSVCLFHAMFGGECHEREFLNVHPGAGHHDLTHDTSELGDWTDSWDNALYSHAYAKFWNNIAKYGVTPDSCAQSFCSSVPEAFKASLLKQG